MNRLGDPKELVGVLLFLASDASTYVTAQTIAVDGGTTASVGISRMPESFRTLAEQQVPGGLAQKIVPKFVRDVAAD